MTFEELRKALKEGKAVATEAGFIYIKMKDGGLAAYRKSDDKFSNMIDGIYFFSDCLLNDKSGFEIYNKPILDKAEKRYLSGVIRPFRKDYKITVKKHRTAGDEELIFIWFFGSESIEGIDFLEGMANLPHFKAGTMYKGMEPDKEYTLEELGL